MSRRKDEGPSRRRLRQDESELWTGVIRSVKPLRRRPQKSASPALDETPKAAKAEPVPAAPAPPPVRPSGKLTRVAKSAPPLAPISRRTKHKLARGSETIDGRIDLHGLTQAQAQNALLQFLHRAQAAGMRFVLVITGKGRMRFDAEREAGVLRREVPRWLTLGEFRAYVVGYEPAHVGHGGEGALYVRLRRARG